MKTAPNSLVAQAEHQDRMAADWLLNYDIYRDAFVQEEKNLIEERAADQAGRRGTKIGDDTAYRGQALAAEQREIKRRWLAVVEETEKALPLHLRVFLGLRREYRTRKGPNGWVPAVQCRFAAIMARRTGSSEFETYRSASRLADYWAEIVNFTVRKAIAEGLFSTRKGDYT